MHVMSNSYANETLVAGTNELLVDDIEGLSGEGLSGSFDFDGQAASGENKAGCFSGFLGTCSDCDTEGSCLCSKWQNGHTDYVSMDRSRWDRTRLLCPNHEIVINVMLAMLTALALEAMWRVSCAIHFQRGVVQKRGLPWHQHLPLLSCCAVFLSMSSQLGVVIIKLVSSEQLLAINLLPSALHFTRAIFGYTAMECDYAYFFVVTAKAQEGSIGRQRVQDIIRHRYRAMPKQILTAFAAWAFPLIIAALTLVGLIESTEVFLVLMLANVTAETVGAANFVWQKQRVASQLASSFDKSIGAVQASLVVASGGANRMRGGLDACRQTLGSGQGVNAQYNRSLLEEEAQLQDAKKALDKHRRQLKIACISLILFTIPFLAVPLLWSRMTYWWLSQAIGSVIFQRQLALTYSPGRYRDALRRVQRV